MEIYQKSPVLPPLLKKRVGRHILVFIGIVCFLGISPFFALFHERAEAEVSLDIEENHPELSIIQGNSLQALKTPLTRGEELKFMGEIPVVVTGYSSSPWETDDTPHITASGTMVREGIVATNVLPFGTKIRLPELFGDKMFVVEDRMSFKKGYQVDIWFPTQWDALNFGVRQTHMEIVQEG